MVFIDGYPDYLRLTAIANNDSEPVNAHTQLIGNILRIVEPFCLDLFFGSNPIEN